MDSLALRIPQQGQGHLDANQPRPSELPAWLEEHPVSDAQTNVSELLSLLQTYNRRLMPLEARIKAHDHLHTAIKKALKMLRERYQNESLPLPEKARNHANLCLQFLDELAAGHKIIVTDLLKERAEHEIDNNLLVLSIKQAVESLGQLLLECYAQYIPYPKGLWGEIHKLYLIAETNNLHKVAAQEEGQEPDPRATVQLAYLRLVMLALAQPNHLMPGQIQRIYDYLEKWSAGCLLKESKVTEAKTGDIFVDLESELPPTIATGYTRFTLANGRFLDINPLRKRLDEACQKMEQKHKQSLKGHPFTIAERMQRNLLNRVNNAWRGRAERESERIPDGEHQVSVCVGLDAAHHFISGGQDFIPEKEEMLIHCPPKDHEKHGLSLIGRDETPWELDGPAHKTKDGLDQTRLSRFGEEVDVWNTQHEREIHVRDKRAAKMAHFQMGPWLRLNKSKGGLSLRRMPENTSRIRVGSLVAYLDHSSTKIWKIGILRWLQDGRDRFFDIGVMTLAHMGIPVAVRSIGGLGAGGEYFRSLLVRPVLSDGDKHGILVPATIYDIGTQLVLNMQTELKYVRLERMIETTGSFSLFEYKEVPIPPAEQVRIKNLGHENE